MSKTSKSTFSRHNSNFSSTKTFIKLFCIRYPVEFDLPPGHIVNKASIKENNGKSGDFAWIVCVRCSVRKVWPKNWKTANLEESALTNWELYEALRHNCVSEPQMNKWISSSISSFRKLEEIKEERNKEKQSTRENLLKHVKAPLDHGDWEYMGEDYHTTKSNSKLPAQYSLNTTPTESYDALHSSLLTARWWMSVNDVQPSRDPTDGSTRNLPFVVKNKAKGKGQYVICHSCLRWRTVVNQGSEESRYKQEHAQMVACCVYPSDWEEGDACEGTTSVHGKPMKKAAIPRNRITKQVHFSTIRNICRFQLFQFIASKIKLF